MPGMKVPKSTRRADPPRPLPTSRMKRQRPWEPPLSDELRRACNAGECELKVYRSDSKASLTIVCRGTKSVWNLLKDVEGWRYVGELDGFVAPAFAADATALNLVSVGLIDVVHQPNARVLTNGFIDIRSGVDDILRPVAVTFAGEWRVHTHLQEQFENAGARIVAALRERATRVAEKRRECQAKAKETQERRAEEERDEEERWERWGAETDARFDAFLAKVRTSRLDTREQMQHTHLLKRIADFMRDKPLLFSEWTPEMLLASERAGIELSVWKVGGESWVNAVYPEPPPGVN